MFFNLFLACLFAFRSNVRMGKAFVVYSKTMKATNVFPQILHIYIYISRLTVVSREAKEEVPCDGLSTNAREYFTRTNLAKTKNTITYEP